MVQFYKGLMVLLLAKNRLNDEKTIGPELDESSNQRAKSIYLL
jgi:hypothetical protein